MSCLCETARRMPLFLCLITPASIFVTYGIALAKDHVSPLLPYISDTGTLPPESCVFGLLLGAVSFLLCIVIYLRYREVSEWRKARPSCGVSPLWNRVAACFGFVSCLGLDLVANFQEKNEFVTHIVGALMCFFSGTLYFLLQTVFTRRMRPQAKCLLWARIVFTLLNVLFIVGTFAPVGAAMKEFKGKDILKWKETDGGFGYHITSTFCEWFLVFSFCAYICTLFWDFRNIRIEPPQIKFLSMPEVDCEAGSETETSEDASEKAKSVWI